MPRYTFSVPANFVFDVDADSDEHARIQALRIVNVANRSDGWMAPDVNAIFPRVSISAADYPKIMIEDVADYPKIMIEDVYEES